MKGRCGIFFTLCLTSCASVAEVTWTPWYTARALPGHQLSTNAITSISKIDNDEVWIATTDEIFLSNGWSVKPISIDWHVYAKYPLQRVLGFFRADSNSLYVFSIRDGIYKLSESEARFEPVETKTPWSARNSISSLLIDPDHNIALSVIDDRVFVFSPKTDAVHELPLNTGGRPVVLLQNDETRDLYILTDEHRAIRYIWQKDRFVKSSEARCEFKSSAIDFAINFTGDTFLFVEHGGTITKASVSGSGCKRIPLSRPMREHLQHSSVHTIKVLDHSGGIALATDHGVFIEQGSDFYLISSNNSALFSDEVLSIEEIGVNRLLIGTFLGLTQASKEGSIVVTSLGSEKRPSVTSIDSSTTLGAYVSTYQKLYRANPSADKISFTELDLRSDFSSISVIRVGKASIWLGFQDGRIAQISDNGQDVFCEYRHLAKKYATAITDIRLVEDRDTKIVASTLGGDILSIEDCRLAGVTTLATPDKKGLTALALELLTDTDMLVVTLAGTGVISDVFNTLSSSTETFIWDEDADLAEVWDLAFSEGDLYSLSPDGLIRKIPIADVGDRTTITSDSDSDWDLKQSSYAIELDLKGRAWVASNSGLHLLENGQSSLQIATYGDIPVSLDFGASHASLSGKIYFGGTGGIVIITTPQLYPSKIAQTFVISKVTTGRKEHLLNFSDSAVDVELQADDSTFGVSFSLTDFQVLDQVTIQHKLEGFDTAWRSAGNTNSVNYSKLPPGDYVFRARGENASGTRSEDEIAISVRVLGPLWLSWWALLSYALLTVMLLWVARRVHEQRVASRLRLEIAEDTAAAYQLLEDQYQELQDVVEQSTRFRGAAADNVLALAKLSTDPMLVPEPTPSATTEHSIVGARLETLRLVQELAVRASTGDKCDLNAALEAIHKQLISEHPEIAPAILLNDVTREPVALSRASYIGLILNEALRFTLLERNYEPGEDPIVEVRMNPPELKESSQALYTIYLRDSAVPHTHTGSFEQALPLSHHFVESTGGELSQTYDGGNVVNIVLRFEASDQ
jgi:hypothetical protein